MIKILKLVTGEEVIGDVTESGSSLVIDKPCILQLMPSRSNPEQPVMALIPYAPYTKEHRVTIDTKNVIWNEEPMKELYNQYNSLFGSGIVVANPTNIKLN